MSRVVLVTGGIGGLGSAIATRLANNYRVVANYLPSLEAQAKQWQAAHAEAGLQIDIVAADVSDAASCEQMASSLLATHGNIDVLINNAGITRDATLRKMPAADWQAVINTNLSSLFYVTKPLLNAPYLTPKQATSSNTGTSFSTPITKKFGAKLSENKSDASPKVCPASLTALTL